MERKSSRLIPSQDVVESTPGLKKLSITFFISCNVYSFSFMNEYFCKGEVVILDRHRNEVLHNEDGVNIVFENRVSAKNFLFSLSYKVEFVESNFLFIPVNYTIGLN
jgi:hypothetical protein